MDRYDAMRVFVRIVERRSFTLAAQDLGLPRATVTDAIKALEARLGARLLQRTTRHVRPTLDGEAYYGRCQRLIADLEDAEAAFSKGKPKGLLRVDVQGMLARTFVMPRLGEFFALYPDIELHMSEGDRFVDLVREGVDCVLRVGELQDSEMVARRLTVLREATCASPAYCQSRGAPQRIEDLAGHAMIGFRSSATGAIMPLEFSVEGTLRTVTLPVAMTVTGAETYFAAALAGLGIIQAPRYRLEKYFNSGELVPLLPDYPPSPSQVSLLYPRSKQLSPRLRVFMDWMVEVFRTVDLA
ncbi:LysR family transcriptional regulator [Phyllobacterium sp. 0TCS1.6C]|uniref:LysR family transcriptional regulator n=1 Tax=unclassified Phyllobacterium TaxID=2638441 RepID=UPI0022656810|nr:MULTISPECIES: LysR family transcriptional regulator [unclassified Phyllobacterium]MCX8281982.1 LysR family transcriptional regulator [Phyllobacterium sp. 0TCS1.6C]MCX8294445.1 LysR family transcriptional regulator [Phyllobacterium sp. 0TCS1.6A]